MANKIRNRRQKIRRRQRKDRQELNDKLKKQGKGWAARRKIIRQNRKADRKSRKSTIKQMQADQIRDGLSKKNRAHHRGRGRGHGNVPMPKPPPGVPYSDAVDQSPGQSYGTPSAQTPRSPFRTRRFAPGPAAPPSRRRAPIPAPMPPAYPQAPVDPWRGRPPPQLQAQPPMYPPQGGYPPPMYPQGGFPPPVDPWGGFPPPVDPWGGFPPPVDPYAFAPMDPMATYWDDQYEWMQLDPLYAADAWNPDGVDPYDDAILIDIDNVDMIPIGDVGLLDEYDDDLLDVASELAGELSALAGSGVVGDSNTEITDLEGLIDQLGQQKLKSLKIIAELDGWNPAAYQRDAQVIVDAVNEVEAALEELAEGGVAGVGGVHIGAAGLTAALSAIPLLSSLVPKIIEKRQDADARQDSRRQRRRRNRAEREDDRDRRLAELEATADAHRSGTLNLDDPDGADWGLSARSGDVIVRAKLGKRAAIAQAGTSPFYVVYEAPEGMSTEAIKSRMQEALAAFAPPQVAGIAGCTCTEKHTVYAR